MELLIRITDKPRSGKIAVDAQRTSAGDVIACAADGHIWGKREVSNPDWRIVRVPGLSRDIAVSLVAVELPVAFGANRLLRKRQLRIDLEQLELLEPGILAERSATARTVDAVVTRANLRACLLLKPSLTDPRLIGPRRGVIG